MDAQQAAIEEYKTLRQEILNHQQFVHQINTTGVAIGAGVAAVVTNESAIEPTKLITLCSGLALLYFPLIMSQVYRRRKEMRIGRYIQIFIEPRVPGLYWESAWHRQSNRDAFFRPALYEAGLLLILQLIYGVVASLTALSEDVFLAIAIIALLMELIYFEIVQIFDKSSIEACTKAWAASASTVLPLTGHNKT